MASACILNIVLLMCSCYVTIGKKAAIQELPVKCINKEKGCEWRGFFGTLLIHVTTCKLVGFPDPAIAAGMTCALCLEVAVNPLQHEKCGKLFCSDCLEERTPCPHCKTKDFKYFLIQSGKYSYTTKWKAWRSVYFAGNYVKDKRSSKSHDLDTQYRALPKDSNPKKHHSLRLPLTTHREANEELAMVQVVHGKLVYLHWALVFWHMHCY